MSRIFLRRYINIFQHFKDIDHAHEPWTHLTQILRLKSDWICISNESL